MATSKKTATKKTTTLRKTKPAAITKAQALDLLEFDTFHVVSERSLLTWNPIIVFATRREAEIFAEREQSLASVSFNKFKVTSVPLFGKSVDPDENPAFNALING